MKNILNSFYFFLLTEIHHLQTKNGLNIAKKILFIAFLMLKVMKNNLKKIMVKDQWPQRVHSGTHIFHDWKYGQVNIRIDIFFSFPFSTLIRMCVLLIVNYYWFKSNYKIIIINSFPWSFVFIRFCLIWLCSITFNTECRTTKFIVLQIRSKQSIGTAYIKLIN